MIPGNKTKNDENVDSLPFSSKKKVLRICDSCGDKKEVAWNTVARCRKKHNRIEDYCHKCSTKKYSSGDNNPSRKPEVRKKISNATKGKSKSFKDGKNLRILPIKIATSGHLLKWIDKEHKHVSEHRLVYAECNNKHHDELKEIHHIDGDKKNNIIDNLIELSKQEHGYLHSQLEKLAFYMVKKGLIIFDAKSKEYHLSYDVKRKTLEKSLGFEDIALLQKKNICSSRLDVNIESEIIRGIKRPIPLIASNMSTVINCDMYIKLFELGAFGIMHRADSEENIISSIKKIAKKCNIVAASIGVDKNQLGFAKSLIRNGCNVITIDVAHGYSDIVLDLGKKLKLFSPNTKVILGNTTNTDLLFECYEFADAIKVGIAQGLACETKNTAGCTEKQFSAVLKFKELSKKFDIPIISDGGIREPADFTKAIAAGANSVMMGSIFASCPESAAETIVQDYKTYKVYAGMASEYVQEKWKGGLKPGTCAEGGVRLLPLGDLLEDLIERYSGALKSGITYAGANDIQSFQKNASFVLL